MTFDIILKGIVRLFELGCETRLLSICGNKLEAKCVYYFNDTISREEHKTIQCCFLGFLVRLCLTKVPSLHFPRKVNLKNLSIPAYNKLESPRKWL
jgi:hypothetical protein